MDILEIFTDASYKTTNKHFGTGIFIINDEEEVSISNVNYIDKYTNLLSRLMKKRNQPFNIFMMEGVAIKQSLLWLNKYLYDNKYIKDINIYTDNEPIYSHINMKIIKKNGYK